jgi:Ca2+-binding EF-hand superfamily protein
LLFASSNMSLNSSEHDSIEAPVLESSPADRAAASSPSTWFSNPLSSIASIYARGPHRASRIRTTVIAVGFACGAVMAWLHRRRRHAEARSALFTTYVGPSSKSIIARLNQLFDVCDQNNDGVVTSQELYKNLATNYEFEDALGYDWKETLQALDTEQAGLVSRQEFLRFMYQRLLFVPPQKEQVLQTIQQLFATCDENNDGIVSKTELFESLSRHPEVEEQLGYRWNQVFEAMDSDASGQVSWHEFKYYLFHHRPGVRHTYVPKQKAALLAHVRQSFLLCATDGTGLVTKSDALQALREHQELEELLGCRWNEVVDSMDANHDDRISWQEFRNTLFERVPLYVPPRKQQALATAQAVFMECSSDEDGAVSQLDIMHALQKDHNIEELLGYCWNEMFSASGVDGTIRGTRITWPEFRYFMFHVSPSFAPRPRVELLRDIRRAFVECSVSQNISVSTDTFVVNQSVLLQYMSTDQALVDLVGFAWVDWMGSTDPNEIDTDHKHSEPSSSASLSWQAFRDLIFVHAPVCLPAHLRAEFDIARNLFLKCPHETANHVSMSALCKYLSDLCILRASSTEAEKEMYAIETIVRCDWADFAAANQLSPAQDLISWPEFRHILSRFSLMRVPQ